MTKAFNKKEYKNRRRSLRRNMPKSEAILWSKLKNKQMLGERFLRQYSVDRYIIDFYCPRLKLAIEVDGDSHFASGVVDYDKERQEHIENYGIHFMRFTNADVCENIDGVCQAICDEIERKLQ
jgi:very-short-patch-repair endonuclease